MWVWAAGVWVRLCVYKNQIQVTKRSMANMCLSANLCILAKCVLVVVDVRVGVH